MTQIANVLVVVRRGKALMYMYMIVTVVAIVDLLLDY